MANPFTKETENYMRLVLLINDKGAEAFRESLLHFSTLKYGVRIFDDVLHDVNAERILRNLKGPGRGKPITAQQWLLLYPGTGVPVEVSKLDITLCFVLLRNICGLAAPVTTWDKQPAPADTSLEGGLAQVKNIRNFISHSKEPKLSDADFKVHFDNACDAILNIEQKLPKWSTTLIELNQFLRRPISHILHTDLSNVVKEWNQQDSDLKTEVANICRDVSAVKTQIDTLGPNVSVVKTCIDKLGPDVLAVKTGVDKLGPNVLAVRTIVDKLGPDVLAVKTGVDKLLCIATKKSDSKDKRKKTAKKSLSETICAFTRKLGKVYQERFKKVQSVSNDGVPTMFDVTSKLYMDLECAPLEMRCTNVDDKKQTNTDKQSLKRKREPQENGPSYKRTKHQNITNPNLIGGSINQMTIKSNEHTEPIPSTSYTEEGQKSTMELNHQNVTSSGNQETSHNRQKEIPDNSEHEKLTTTAHITRLFTTDANPSKLPILVEAEAGVGKTTLFHRLALNWSNGAKDMDRFKLVFLIPLRRVKSKKIEDIICDDLQLLKSDHKRDLKKCLDLWDENILFLIDGLDEVKLTQDNDLTKLLQGTGKHVFCSSRPMLRDSKNKQGCHGIEHHLLVKLLGFSDDTLVSYINQYFRKIEGSTQNMADTVMKECSRHFYCRSLMKIPLYAGLLCYLWKSYQNEFPDTATQLFNRFLTEILNNYVLRYSHPSNPCNNNLHMMTSTERVLFLKSPMEKTVPPNLRSLLERISKLAYTTLMEHKVIFTVEDVDNSNLSLADVTHIGLFTIEEQDGSLIYFRHKLFHEYFAGLYLSLNGTKVYSLFGDCRDKIISRSHILQNAFFFAAGLCEDPYEKMIFVLNYQNHLSIKCANCRQNTVVASSSFNHSSQSSNLQNIITKKCCKTLMNLDLHNIMKYDFKFSFRSFGDCKQCSKMACAMMYPDFEMGRASSLDVHIEDLQVLSFFVQLSFEHHASKNDRGISRDLSRLPVHCSSAHSLAAVMYTLQVREKNLGSRRNASISMVLIGGPVIDIDQLLCILNECNNNEDIKYITLMKAGQTLIKEILNIEWKHVNKVGFEECGMLVPIKTVIKSFPSTDVVFYDKSTWKNGKMNANKDYCEPLQNIAIILKVRKHDKREEESVYGDNIDPCLGISARNLIAEDKVVTVCVDEGIEWFSADSERYIPKSAIKGICESDRCGDDGVLSAMINEYGVQWHHHEYKGKNTLRDIEGPLVFQEKDEILQLTDEFVVGEHMTDILDIVRRLFTNTTSRLIIHDAGINFVSQLLTINWLIINTICFKDCKIIVPVDVIAENMPNVKNIEYDLDTVINGQTFTQIQTSGIPQGKNLKEKLSLTFVNGLHALDHLRYRGSINVCQMCTDTNYRHIQIWVHRDNDEQKSFDRYLLCHVENVKSVCWFFPCNLHFQHLERLHTDDNKYIATIHEQNPDLTEVVLLDASTTLQMTNPTVDKVLAVLQKGGQKWKKTLVFGCECIFHLLDVQSKDELVSLSNGLKPTEMSYDQVQAWCDKRYEVLNEQEHFVLQHFILHHATKKNKYHVLPEERVMSWMTVQMILNLDIKPTVPVKITVNEVRGGKISVKFTKD